MWKMISVCINMVVHYMVEGHFFPSSLFLLMFNWPFSPSFSLDVMFHTCTCNLRDRQDFASTNAKGNGWIKMRALMHDGGVDTLFFLSIGKYEVFYVWEFTYSWKRKCIKWKLHGSGEVHKCVVSSLHLKF